MIDLGNRFTDFLVFEIDLDGNAIHLKSLAKPDPPKKNPIEEKNAPQADADSMTGIEPDIIEDDVEVANRAESSSKPETEQPAVEVKSDEPWPDSFNTKLAPFLSPESISQLKEIFLQGPEPPLVSDSGWAGRVKSSAEDAAASPLTESAAQEPDVDKESVQQSRGRGRGDRGKRGGGRGGRRGRGNEREDNRKVLSEVGVQKFTAYILPLIRP
jgi:tRNA pseudouridine13 synthase